MNSPQLDFEEWPYRCDFIPNPHVSVLCAPPGSPNHQQRIETSGKAIIALAWTNVIEKAKHEANGQVIHLIPCWSPKEFLMANTKVNGILMNFMIMKYNPNILTSVNLWFKINPWFWQFSLTGSSEFGSQGLHKSNSKCGATLLLKGSLYNTVLQTA